MMNSLRRTIGVCFLAATALRLMSASWLSEHDPM
jgi:hypothetical protein